MTAAPEPSYDNEPLPPEPFDIQDAPPTPQNLAQATWMMRKLRSLRTRIDENDDAHKQIIAEADEWIAAINGQLHAEADELERQLGNFLIARITEDPRGPKSLTLPTGSIKSNAGGLSTVIHDEAAFLAWATEHRPELVNVPAPPKPKPDKKALLKAATAKDAEERFLAPAGSTDEVGEVEVVDPATGEPVPGVKLVRADRSIKVEPGR